MSTSIFEDMISEGYTKDERAAADNLRRAIHHAGGTGAGDFKDRLMIARATKLTRLEKGYKKRDNSADVAKKHSVADDIKSQKRDRAAEHMQDKIYKQTDSIDQARLDKVGSNKHVQNAINTVKSAAKVESAIMDIEFK